MTHDKVLQEKTDGLFGRFCKQLAKLDLRTAAVVPAAIGAAVAMYGVGLEVHGTSELLQHGGHAAVDAYRTAMAAYGEANDIGALDYIKLGLQGQLPSFGGNAQGTGIGLAYVGPAISTAAVMLARGFDKVKAFLDEKLVGFNAAQPERPATAERFALGDIVSGGSLALREIEANRGSAKGFFVEGRQKGLADHGISEDEEHFHRPRM